MRTGRTLEVGAVTTMAGALVLSLAVGEEQTMGNLARILFVHVPAAWLAYLAFVITLLGSALYLIRKDLRWDRLAASSAEVGVFFTALTIALGMIWGKPTWGVWWTWDARLVLTAILLFVYLGYLALRRSIPDRVSRARRSAWLGMVAVVQIPIVHFSVLWWRTLHQPPTVLRPGEMQMDPPFRAALFASLFAFTVVYAALLRRRIEVAQLEDLAEKAAASAERRVAGAAVTAPGAPETAPPADTGEVRRRPGAAPLLAASALVTGALVTASQSSSLSPWGWVAYAFGATYASMAVYALWLTARRRAGAGVAG